MCEKFTDKSSLDQDFYNCKLIRQIFTTFFDDWLKSKDFTEWQNKKTTSQTEKEKDQTELTDEQKLERAKNCGHNSWEEYKSSNWTC